MTTRRRHWRTPNVSVKSVSEALGAGETAGPMAPGLIAGPNPLFGPNPGPVLGPNRGPVFGPPPAPIEVALFPSRIAPLDGPPVPSDVRLKEDITPVGSSAGGFPLYTFRYRGQPGLYQGVMAQDVLKTRPDALIVDADGFYMVDYGKLGIEFRRIQ